MNTKERLIEELKKDNWTINIYDDFNRVKILFIFLSILDIKWVDGTKIDECFPFMPAGFIRCDDGISAASINEHGYKELTQLFNEYLEEHEPKVWLHSVLSAIQLGLKVEHKDRDGWWETNTLLGVGARSDLKYRIGYKKSESIKLVPDEIWDILDDSMVAIAKDKNGKVFSYVVKPDITNNGLNQWYGDGVILNINYLKIMKTAKIHDIDWKKSLCIRPTK